MSTPHIRLISATKSYGPATVLKDVSFDVLPGEVHVLAGENGAGKSTLIKIVGGVITDYVGTLEIGGEKVTLRSPHDAVQRGIAVIHQELSLVPSMTIADNLFLGDHPCKFGFVQTGEVKKATQAALERVGLNLAADTEVGSLPIATQQLIEVAKALRHEAKVVVMDEPTSALNIQEAERLFALIEDLKSKGVGIVYISHKMEEIERLATRITVLRDGQWIATAPAQEMPVEKLVELMVGREQASDVRDQASGVLGDVALEASGVTVKLNGRTLVDDLSLSVRQGEVLGLAGLEGSGNSNFLLGIFGAYGKLPQGHVKVQGSEMPVRSPRHSIDHGMALLTSDRKATGLVLPLSVVANTVLASLPRVAPKGWRSDSREEAATRKATEPLHLRAASLDMPVGELSGGNQQKVAIAKWLLTDPKVLLLDEPTRGIDINAKREIYRQIEEWKAAGMAIVLITSELSELLLLSDRILVMHRGRAVTEFDRKDATAEKVVQAALNS